MLSLVHNAVRSNMLSCLATCAFYAFGVIIVLVLCLAKYINGAVLPKSKVCLVGKTAIVTGANRGIGLEVAIVLAMRGCRVILACRNNLDAAKQKIIEKTKNPNIAAIHLDLSSLDSVRAFAKQVNESEDRLDILIHNAVAVQSSIKFNEDGLNPVVQVSHFGPFLLTHLLVGLMKKTGSGRIVFVSSLMAHFSNLKIEQLNFNNELVSTGIVTEVYSNNKLCNIMSAIGFAEKLKQYGITANAVHPGMVLTSIFDAIFTTKDSWKFKLLYVFCVLPFSKNLEEGTYAIIDVATDERYINSTGKFIFDRGPTWLPSQARDAELCKKVWTLSEEYVKLRPEERL